LLGEKAIVLILGTSTELAQTGDTLYTEVQQGLSDEVRKEILPVKQKAEDLLSSMDSFVVVMQTILRTSKIEGSFSNFEKATENIATVTSNMNKLVVDESASINRILSNIEGITANVNSG